jgi:hypothetical protein
LLWVQPPSKSGASWNRHSLFESFLRRLPPKAVCASALLPAEEDLNQILRKTRWHHHVAGLRAVEVTRLVDLPPAYNGRDIRLERLRNFILAYFRMVVDEARSGPTSILRRVHSESDAPE